MANTRKITLREKMAVRLAVLTEGRVSPPDLYRVGYAGSIDKVENLADLPAVASRWWRSQKIQDYYLAEKTAYEARKRAEREALEVEVIQQMKVSENEDLEHYHLKDYSKPENAIRKLNELVNTAADPGEALDALKVLLARQDELAPAIRPEPTVRAYLPLMCSSCPLYLREKERLK